MPSKSKSACNPLNSVVKKQELFNNWKKISVVGSNSKTEYAQYRNRLNTTNKFFKDRKAENNTPNLFGTH